MSIKRIIDLFTILLKRYLNSKKLIKLNPTLRMGYMCTSDKCKFGEYNTLGHYVELSNTHIDNFTYIGKATIINNAKIGKYCSIAPRCKIGLGMHPSDFVSTHSLFFSTTTHNEVVLLNTDKFLEFKEIKIGHDVWIGESAIVQDGVEIGNGAIIGSGAVVTKDVPPYAVVGGVPAKVIKYRFNSENINFLLSFCWWDKDLEWLKQNAEKFDNINNFNL